MKKVLITGATGFLGSYLLKHLNQMGIPVRIYRRQTSSLMRIREDKFEDCVGELGSEYGIRNAISGCDTFFHLAACTSLLGRDRKLRIKTNVTDVQMIRSALGSEKGIRFIYCSTVGAIGILREPVVMSESSAFTGGDIHYFETKRQAEEIVQSGARGGLNAVIVSPGTVLGPHMLHNQMDAFTRASEGELLFYPPGGNSFCFVHDVVKGMIAAAEKGQKGERYILAGHNMTFREYFTKISQTFGQKPPKFQIPGALLPVAGQIAELFFRKYGKDFGLIASRYGYYSSAKAKSELGYEITPFEEMIRKI